MNYIEILKLECSTLIKNACINNNLNLDINNIEIIETLLNNKNGDFYTTFAIKNSKKFEMTPNEICNLIINNIKITDNKYIEKISVKNNFINFNINKKFFINCLIEIFNEKNDYGKNYLKNENIIVEYVSANPTGQMHMGNARGGVIGDCLSGILQYTGYNVTKEFFINDAGNQINLLGLSVFYRYKEILKKLSDNDIFPKNGYYNNEILEIAKYIIKVYGNKFLYLNENDALNELSKLAIKYNLKNIKEDLKRYNIFYDNWFSEVQLHDSGYIKETIDILLKKNIAYEKNQTVFFKVDKIASEEDDVLVRNDGTYTYFASDIAYHRNKIEKRKFDQIINIWGTDHHGHIFRLKKAIDDLELYGSQKIKIILIQLVHLISENKKVKMSKRTGKLITLRTLLDEVPIDSIRFFFNNYHPNTHMNFDLNIAVNNEMENPIYYVKYAYVRIISILSEIQYDFKLNNNFENIFISCEEEIDLLKCIIQFPNELELSIKLLDTSRLNKYLTTLCIIFHKFYSKCNINKASLNIKNTRLMLCTIIKNIIENSFKILKLTLPKNM